jgi:hypothetical protein
LRSSFSLALRNLPRELLHERLRRPLEGREPQIFGRTQLVGVAQRFRPQNAVFREYRDEIFLLAHDEGGDAGAAVFLHGRREEPVGLVAAACGHEEVRAVEVEGIELRRVDEASQVDLARLHRCERLQLLIGDDDVRSGSIS